MVLNYGFSITGKSHLKRNIVCQDSHKIKKMDNGWVIAAVADGVGSAENSHIGSKIAVETVVTFCEECMPYDYNVISIKSMMRTAYNYALKCIYREAEKTGNPVESYDTTLTMVIYDGHRIIYGHSGDGAILGLTQYGNYVEITSPQKGADLVSVLPLRAGYTQWVIDSYEEDLVAVLLVTDGMLETICPYLLKFGEGSIYVPLAMFFSDPYCVDSDEAIDNIHQFLLAEDEYENDKFYNSIGMALYKHILDQARANEIYERIKNTNYPVVLMKSEQDDKTVVGLINADAELENQVVSYYDEPDWHKLQDMWNRRAYPHLYQEEKLSESDNADDLSESVDDYDADNDNNELREQESEAEKRVIQNEDKREIDIPCGVDKKRSDVSIDTERENPANIRQRNIKHSEKKGEETLPPRHRQPRKRGITNRILDKIQDVIDAEQ